jgi:hypothetical protein
MFHETWRMEKMFKKTLLALAIAGTAFGASATLTLDAGSVVTATGTKAQVISAEGAANTTSFAMPAVVATTSGTVTGYATTDKIRVTITGGTLTPATNVGLAYTVVGGSGVSVANLATSGTVTYPSTTVAMVALATADANQINGTTGALAATDTFTVSGLDIAPTSVAAGSTVTYKVEVLSSVGGAVIDTVTGTVAVVATQLSASVTADLGTNDIDVGDDRLSFDNSGSKVLTDSLGVTAASAKVDLLSIVATAEKATTVLTGSFGFLDTNADGKVTAADAGTTSATINTAFTTATVVGAATGFDGSAAQTSIVTTNFTVDGKTQVLVPQTFSVDVEFDYVDAENKDATFAKTLTGGAWTLNGDSAFIPFMPFSSAFAQSITVTNSGTVAGTITVDITANGDTKSHTLTAVAGAEMVTNITGEIIAFAKADGVTGNAAINVVTNSPSADISVSALYYSKADADRGIVSVVNK